MLKFARCNCTDVCTVSQCNTLELVMSLPDPCNVIQVVLQTSCWTRYTYLWVQSGWELYVRGVAITICPVVQESYLYVHIHIQEMGGHAHAYKALLDSALCVKRVRTRIVMSAPRLRSVSCEICWLPIRIYTSVLLWTNVLSLTH